MSYTLLLADDSVTIQRVIELTFADEDIQVIAVGDGQQAIDRITADPPDIVLADTGMPERDGYEVATFIKEDPALAHIPVVLLTGAFEPVDEDRARRVGCDAVLVKPFEPQAVINRVRELLGRRSAVADPAASGSATVAPPQNADADALTPRAETAGRPADDPDETLELGSRVSSGSPEPATQPDDPLADYLDRMDQAFDRFEAGESAASGRESTGSEEPRPKPDTVEDPVPADFSPPPDAAPAVPAPQAPFRPEPVVPVASAPDPTSEGVIELASLTGVPRPVKPPEPPPAELAPPPAPVDTPPSLADAFASLLAAEQGGAERAQRLYPWPRPASSPAMQEALIDRVVERVIVRLSDGVTGGLVANVVARVAEKLVREELERSKPV